MLLTDSVAWESSLREYHSDCAVNRWRLAAMPRIEYQLSFENYLEMTSSAGAEKRDLRLPSIIAVLGFLCFAVGFIDLRETVSEQAPFVPGGLLLLTGLVLTCLAMVFGLVSKKKSVRRTASETTLRRLYEFECTDKRAFEFDENGWRVWWKDGEDVRPWSILVNVTELKTLLVLWTSSTPYWIPKDALEKAGQLAPLKALAQSKLEKGEVLFDVSLKPSAVLYVEAKLFHHWRRGWLTRALGGGAASLFIYWVFFDSPQGSSQDWRWIFLIPISLFFLECLFYLLE